MARKRRQASNDNSTTNTNERNNKMAALTQEQIQELLSNQRSRGDYDAVLSDFLDSGEAGIQVDLDSGVLAGKDAKKVKTGLDNARKRINQSTGKPVFENGHAVKVIVAEDNVFLINTTSVGTDEA